MDNQRQASEVELARFAGFFAADGCVGIWKAGNHVKIPYLNIDVGSSERFWCEEFYKYFGGYVRVYIRKSYKNALPYYHWTTKQENAATFIRAIFPYLIGEKREQAKIALRYAAILETRPDRNQNGKRGHFLVEEIAAMVQLKEELKLLRRAAAETKRESVSPVRSDSPTLEAIPV